MKKDSIKYGFLACLGLFFLMTACGPRTIPDKKLALIIRDVFIVNAYKDYTDDLDFSVDTVDIYEPILEQYGYTTEDLRHSLNRMAMKKSSRLSELIDQATADIEAENNYYAGEKRLQAQIDSSLISLYRDTVYVRDSSRTVRDRAVAADSLRIIIPAEEGTYRLSYNYLIDSADMNNYIPMRYYVKDSLGKQVLTRASALTRHRPSTYSADIYAAERADTLEVLLADYSATLRRPYITIDSVLITYTPPLAKTKIRYVRENLGFDPDTYLPYGISIYPAPDSGALHLVGPLRVEPASDTEL